MPDSIRTTMVVVKTMKEWLKSIIGWLIDFIYGWLYGVVWMIFIAYSSRVVEKAKRWWRTTDAERATGNTLDKPTRSWYGKRTKKLKTSVDSVVAETDSESRHQPPGEEYYGKSTKKLKTSVYSVVAETDSESRHQPPGEEYMTIAGNSNRVKNHNSTNVQELSVGNYQSLDESSPAKETEGSDIDEEYFPGEHRPMPDGEDASTTEEKDSYSDTSSTKQTTVTVFTASIGAYERLHDDLDTDLPMKSPHDGKNLQLPSMLAVSNNVRPQTDPNCQDELDFHVGRIDCETDAKTDSAPPQKLRQKRGSSTSDKNPPLDPLGNLTRPAPKKANCPQRQRKRNKRKRKKKNEPEVAHHDCKATSSSDELSKGQKRLISTTQGSSHKPATATPVAVTSQKKSSPPPGKSTKQQTKFAPDSIAESSKEEGDNLVTGHSLYNPAEQKPAPGRSSGDEVTLPPHPLSAQIEMPMPRESKEGPCQHSAPIEQSQEHAEDTLCSGEISERDKSPGPDIIPQARSKRSERLPTAEELDEPNDEPPHAVEDAQLLPPRRPQEELALPENPDPLFWLSMMPDDPDPCRAPPEDDDGDMIDTAMIFVTPIPSSDTGGSADFVSGMFPYGRPYQQTFEAVDLVVSSPEWVWERDNCDVAVYATKQAMATQGSVPMQAVLEVDKCPSDEFSLKNCAVVNKGEPIMGGEERIFVKITKHTSDGVKEFYLTVLPSPRFPQGRIGLSGAQREWIQVTLSNRVHIDRVIVNKRSHLVGKISLEVDFYQKQKKAQAAINTDELAPLFNEKFNDNIFTAGQTVVLGFEKVPLLKAKVLQITAEDVSQLMGKGASGAAKRKINFGILHPGSRVIFEKRPDSVIQLLGRFKGDSAHVSIISPDWNFSQMGIGGLDKEFSDIFRRAFASRVFPPDVIEQLGMKHVRGILLYGPPGTGKTLMARQIGKMLHAREPKIVNGPEVLNKYVGESEANIRNLFGEAETDQKKMGINSALHIIIFDEIDAICRTRGSLSGSTGVHDTVVNQLLAKIDGVEQLNNILVIGMTNRIDMIDEALLRPGRLEVQMEIGLPDEDGRVEILEIHTTLMRNNGKLASNVDLKYLAKKTRNFSGAEIEGLVRSAQSTAMNKMIQAQDKVMVTHEAADKLKIGMIDFEHALQYDLKPAFGISDDTLDNYVLNGIIPWGAQVQELLDVGKAVVKQATESVRTPLVSVLLRGEVGCGKTALAAHIAKVSQFPFVKVVTPENMIGYTEGAKCQAIKKVFDDAYKSELSCIVIDDIERLLDYVSIGPRFSNLVLQALLVLLRKIPPITHGKGQHKLLIIGTTGLSDEVLERTGIRGAFNSCIEVPYLTSPRELMTVIRGDTDEKTSMYSFTSQQLETLELKLKGMRLCIGIKKLLAILEASLRSEDPISVLVKKMEEESKTSLAVKRLKLADGYN